MTLAQWSSFLCGSFDFIVFTNLSIDIDEFLAIFVLNCQELIDVNLKIRDSKIESIFGIQ